MKYINKSRIADKAIAIILFLINSYWLYRNIQLIKDYKSGSLYLFYISENVLVLNSLFAGIGICISFLLFTEIISKKKALLDSALIALGVIIEHVSIAF